MMIFHRNIFHRDEDSTLKSGSQKYDKLSLKIVQKALKWLFQYANFQKLFWGACPRTPLNLFLLLKLVKINSVGKNYA